MDPISQPQNPQNDLKPTNQPADGLKDTQSSPELDNLMNELNNYNPETDPTLVSGQNSDASNPSKPEFTPSAGLRPTSTTSASISNPGPSSPLAAGTATVNSPADSTLNGPSRVQTDTSDSYASPSGYSDDATSTESSSADQESAETDDPDQPIAAAPPVPGSIGSAVSYTDVEKKQLEEAKKNAEAKPKAKLSATTILVIVVAILLVISGVIIALIFLSEPKKAPTEAANKNVVQQAETKTLTCVRPLNTNETATLSASYGNFERQFIFKSNNLDTLNESYIYQFETETAATAAKEKLDGEIQNEAGKQTSTVVTINQLKKTTAVSAENLDNFLKSNSDYSSVTDRSLNGFLTQQNQQGLSCTTIE
mgnify:FL=1